MRSRDADAPHFAVPFRLGPGGTYVEAVEQDSPEEVRGCVQVVLATPRGHFPHAPEFGVADLAHRELTDDLGDVVEAVEAAEPRVAAGLEDVDYVVEQAARRVRVEVGRVG